MSMVKDLEMVGESPLKDGLRSTDPSSPSTEQEDCPRDSLVSEKEMLRSDWTGPNDKTNPRNWPVPVRVYQTAIPSLCGFVMFVVHLCSGTLTRIGGVLTNILAIEHLLHLSLFLLSHCFRSASTLHGRQPS